MRGSSASGSLMRSEASYLGDPPTTALLGSRHPEGHAESGEPGLRGQGADEIHGGAVVISVARDPADDEVGDTTLVGRTADGMAAVLARHASQDLVDQLLADPGDVAREAGGAD